LGSGSGKDEIDVERGVMVLKRLMWVLMVIVVSSVVFCGFVIAVEKRGDAPRCQEACLKEHSLRMKRMMKEYVADRNKVKYQERVENELTVYSGCLTNCREVNPVK
jgi:hypothetical protein